MEQDLLLGIDTWIIAVTVLLLAMGISQLTFRLGRRWRTHLDAPARANSNTIEVAMLGLLGLLLAFSLSMSVTRFDMRRTLMVDEVNAIGTAWLRAGLMPEPVRSNLRLQLSQYADSRAQLFEAPYYWRGPYGSKGEELRRRVWEEVSEAAATDPRSIPAGLSIQALNDVIDLHTRRDVANMSHVPELVWWLLIAITCLAMASVGFNDALGSHANWGARIVLGLVLTATLSTTFDLDRPRRGIIRVSQQPMHDLSESLRDAR